MKPGTFRARIGILYFGAILILASSGGRGRAAVLEIGKNFTGSTLGVDSNALPPDSDGAVGPAHFVEFINGRFSVFEKATANRVQTMTDHDFWVNAGVSLPSNLDVSDARILFDPGSQRWFASQVDLDRINQTTNRFLLAVSSTSDPTLSWKGFGFQADPSAGTFADFPTMGVDADGIYLGAELFDDTGSDLGPMVVAVPKANLLAAPPNVGGRTFFGPVVLAKLGEIPQPAITIGQASGGESVLAIGDLGLDFGPHGSLGSFVIEGAASAGNAILARTKLLTVPEYEVPINAPQPNGLNNLDNGDARISSSVYRIEDILYAVHSTEVDHRAAIQWFKVNAVDSTLIQSGIVSDAQLDLFYASIAANRDGTVVIGCNGSSLNTFVSSYAILGETGTNGLSFGPLQLLKAGAASYLTSDSSGTSRWGDFSATSPDPSDPNRFWTIQLIPSRRSAWSTQITELIVRQPQLSASVTANGILLSWPAAVSGLQLQFRPNFSPGSSWAAFAQAPVASSNQVTVLAPAQGKEGFFRLVRP